MALTPPPIASEEAAAAMLAGLMGLIRGRLRERVMAAIDPEIDAAVDAAMEAFKVKIQGYRDHLNDKTTLEIIIKKIGMEDRP